MKTPILLFCALSAAFAADLPYAGKWKENIAKSDFGQTFVTYQSLPGGEWQAESFGVAYKFKMDGKEYSDGMGGTVIWKAIDASTWEMVSKTGARVSATDTLKLSADGKSLTDTGKEMKADGGSMPYTSVYQRVSGGPGLAGKWQTKKVSGSPQVMEFTQSGSDGLTFKESDIGMSCEAKLDGKDYACTGPMLPAGFTVAMKNMPPRSLEITVKKDGKPYFQATYVVSADGKSMVETGGAVASTDQFKIVLDRM